jgi:hypothetical protein
LAGAALFVFVSPGALAPPLIPARSGFEQRRPIRVQPNVFDPARLMGQDMCTGFPFAGFLNY